MKTNFRVNAIDNLRALAVLLVIAYHFFVILGIKNTTTLYWGMLGVKIFFAISAYLLYGSLIRNINKSNFKNTIINYFVNRIFRIAPAYYFNLLVILLLTPFFITYYPFIFSFGFLKQIVAHFLFSAYFIYRDNGFGLNGSYWTLSIEMLWYIFLPLIVLFTRTKTILKLCFGIAFSLIYLAALQFHSLDFLVHLIQPDSKFNVSYDSLIVYLSFQLPGQLMFFCAGILILKLQKNFESFKKYNSFLNIIFIATVVFIVFFVSYFTPGELLSENIYLFLVVIVIFLLMLRINLNKMIILSWIGEISYSLYLWHYPILAIFKKINILNYCSLELTGIIFLILLFLLSSASYYFVEKTGFELRNKFKSWLENPSPSIPKTFRGPNQLE
jgi:peptidoglycan/LPS O-acetylase OafA/YrhL